MNRETYRLTPPERLAFAKFSRGWHETAGHVHRFWWAVGKARGLDPATIIGVPFQPDAFTALPWDHRKHWCWPLPLKCKPTVATLEQEGDDRTAGIVPFQPRRKGAIRQS